MNTIYYLVIGITIIVVSLSAMIVYAACVVSRRGEVTCGCLRGRTDEAGDE